MKKVSIIYWSRGGNVEILAKAIAKSAEEAGANVQLKNVSDASIEDIVQADTLALGSPAMFGSEIEQEYMEPYIRKLELLHNNRKKIVLFGSYVLDNKKFMDQWEERMTNCGFDVIGHIAVKESPSKDELQMAQDLGIKLTM